MTKRRKREICFNSTLVQLKAINVLYSSAAICCFNSTLVQLKDNVLRQIRGVVQQFQFYLSSIKSSTSERLNNLKICFNSTLVQLKGN